MGRARMRYFCLIGLALTLSGCALERSVTFIYYPNEPLRPGDIYPARFDQDAQAECGKYGLVAVHNWDNYTTYQRVRVNYRCVTR
jgi:hypothetical protein